MWCKKSIEKYFPWVEDVCQDFSKTFSSKYESEALLNLIRNVINEVGTLKDRYNKERSKAFFETLGFFIDHFCQKKDCLEILTCQILLLSNLIKVWFVISKGYIETEYMSRVLTIISASGVHYSSLCDALLLVNPVKKKHHDAYCSLLRNILCGNSQDIVGAAKDPATYLKILLLFRRLKFLSKDPVEKSKVRSVVSGIKFPPSTKVWLLSNDYENFQNVNVKKMCKEILAKHVEKDTLFHLRKVLLFGRENSLLSYVESNDLDMKKTFNVETKRPLSDEESVLSTTNKAKKRKIEKKKSKKRKSTVFGEEEECQSASDIVKALKKKSKSKKSLLVDSEEDRSTIENDLHLTVDVKKTKKKKRKLNNLEVDKIDINTISNKELGTSQKVNIHDSNIGTSLNNPTQSEKDSVADIPINEDILKSRVKRLKKKNRIKQNRLVLDRSETTTKSNRDIEALDEVNTYECNIDLSATELSSNVREHANKKKHSLIGSSTENKRKQKQNVNSNKKNEKKKLLNLSRDVLEVEQSEHLKNSTDSFATKELIEVTEFHSSSESENILSHISYNSANVIVEMASTSDSAVEETEFAKRREPKSPRSYINQSETSKIQNSDDSNLQPSKEFSNESEIGEYIPLDDEHKTTVLTSSTATDSCDDKILIKNSKNVNDSVNSVNDSVYLKEKVNSEVTLDNSDSCKPLHEDSNEKLESLLSETVSSQSEVIVDRDVDNKSELIDLTVPPVEAENCTELVDLDSTNRKGEVLGKGDSSKSTTRLTRSAAKTSCKKKILCTPSKNVSSVDDSAYLKENVNLHPDSEVTLDNSDSRKSLHEDSKDKEESPLSESVSSQSEVIIDIDVDNKSELIDLTVAPVEAENCIECVDLDSPNRKNKVALAISDSSTSTTRLTRSAAKTSSKKNLCKSSKNVDSAKNSIDLKQKASSHTVSEVVLDDSDSCVSVYEDSNIKDKLSLLETVSDQSDVIVDIEIGKESKLIDLTVTPVEAECIEFVDLDSPTKKNKMALGINDCNKSATRLKGSSAKSYSSKTILSKPSKIVDSRADAAKNLVNMKQKASFYTVSEVVLEDSDSSCKSFLEESNVKDKLHLPEIVTNQSEVIVDIDVDNKSNLIDLTVPSVETEECIEFVDLDSPNRKNKVALRISDSSKSVHKASYQKDRILLSEKAVTNQSEVIEIDVVDKLESIDVTAPLVEAHKCIVPEKIMSLDRRSSIKTKHLEKPICKSSPRKTSKGNASESIPLLKIENPLNTENSYSIEIHLETNTCKSPHQKSTKGNASEDIHTPCEVNDLETIACKSLNQKTKIIEEKDSESIPTTNNLSNSEDLNRLETILCKFPQQKLTSERDDFSKLGEMKSLDTTICKSPQHKNSSEKENVSESVPTLKLSFYTKDSSSEMKTIENNACKSPRRKTNEKENVSDSIPTSNNFYDFVDSSSNDIKVKAITSESPKLQKPSKNENVSNSIPTVKIAIDTENVSSSQMKNLEATLPNSPQIKTIEKARISESISIENQLNSDNSSVCAGVCENSSTLVDKKISDLSVNITKKEIKAETAVNFPLDKNYLSFVDLSLQKSDSSSNEVVQQSESKSSEFLSYRDQGSLIWNKAFDDSILETGQSVKQNENSTPNDIESSDDDLESSESNVNSNYGSSQRSDVSGSDISENSTGKDSDDGKSIESSPCTSQSLKQPPEMSPTVEQESKWNPVVNMGKRCRLSSDETGAVTATGSPMSCALESELKESGCSPQRKSICPEIIESVDSKTDAIDVDATNDTTVSSASASDVNGKTNLECIDTVVGKSASDDNLRTDVLQITDGKVEALKSQDEQCSSQGDAKPRRKLRGRKSAEPEEKVETLPKRILRRSSRRTRNDSSSSLGIDFDTLSLNTPKKKLPNPKILSPVLEKTSKTDDVGTQEEGGSNETTVVEKRTLRLTSKKEAPNPPNQNLPSQSAKVNENKNNEESVELKKRPTRSTLKTTTPKPNELIVDNADPVLIDDNTNGCKTTVVKKRSKRVASDNGIDKEPSESSAVPSERRGYNLRTKRPIVEPAKLQL